MKPQQTTLDFGAAAGRHAERVALAVLAVARLAAGRRWELVEAAIRSTRRPTTYLLALARLIFDATEAADPGADPFLASLADLADRLFASRSTIVRAVAAAVDARLVRRSIGPDANAYAIDWPGIFSRCGIPAECLTAPPAPRSSSVTETLPSVTETLPSVCETRAFGGSATPDNPRGIPRPQSPPPRGRAIETKETKEGTNSNLPSYQYKDSMTNGAAAGPVPIAAALADALDSFGDRADAVAAKQRLAARIRGVVPEAADWLVGKAADLVVFLDVPPRDLDAALRDVAAMRATGKLGNPAGFFLRQIERVAARHGVSIAKQRTTPAKAR